MVARELIVALTDARRRMSAEHWERLASRIGTADGCPDARSIRQFTADLHHPDAAWMLSRAFAMNAAARWIEIAAAMTTVECLIGDGALQTEIVWTGPASNRFPIRRIDQVLYDMVSDARKRILLVTFAAYRIPRLCAHLASAVERGVDLTFIMESETESEGQLARDAVLAFGNLPLTRIHQYYWPVERRERNALGRPGKLHAKCAVVDDTALIGSANLTDDAFNRNIEVGIIIRERQTVSGLTAHLDELIRCGILVEARP